MNISIGKSRSVPATGHIKQATKTKNTNNYITRSHAACITNISHHDRVKKKTNKTYNNIAVLCRLWVYLCELPLQCTKQHVTNAQQSSVMTDARNRTRTASDGIIEQVSAAADRPAQRRTTMLYTDVDSQCENWWPRPSPVHHADHPYTGLRLPSQPQSITTPWLVPRYTAWWQRHIGVNTLPKLVTQLLSRVGFEPTTCWSQVQCSTRCATPK